MANYIFNLPHYINAEQYTGGNSPFDQVKNCYLDWNDMIDEVPGDMLGSCEDEFPAIKTGETFQRIEKGDWIINKDGAYYALSNSVFSLFFTAREHPKMPMSFEK